MRAGAWEVEAEAMMTAFGDDADIMNAVGPVVRLGYLLTLQHEAEVGFERIETEDDLSERGEARVDIRSVTLGYVHNLRAEADLVPFFTLGLGLERMEAPDTPIRSRVPEKLTSLQVFAGGGVRAFFGRWFNVRAEFLARAVDAEPDMHLDLRVGLGAGMLLGK